MPETLNSSQNNQITLPSVTSNLMLKKKLLIAAY